MKFTNYLIAVSALCACYSCSNKSTSINPPTPEPKPNDTSTSKVVYWLTTGDQHNLLTRKAALPYAEGVASDVSITIDTTQQFQQMDGFGYTLTGGSATLLHQMPDDARSKLLTELFDDGENSINVSYLRISIGASDLSADVYTYNDLPAGQTDPDLSEFSIESEKAHLIPLLKEIIAISPDIKILATPWTPPVWMKDNGNSVGGSLKTEYYSVYASYFVKYIQAMAAEGISITAITPQNEPLHDGNNPSLLMLAEQQANFIKNHLGPAFQTAGLSTKIIIYDHNCDNPAYPLAILNDPAAKAFVDGSAFHLYAGDISALSQVRSAHPDKNVYFTEQYTASTGEFAGDLRWHLKNLVVGAPRNWSKTVLEWNLANDPSFGPHTPGGCTTCKGGLTINGASVQRNVAYYIIAHISKFVPPGSVRIASPVTGGIHTVAFLTPSKQKVLVVLNDNDAAATFTIKLNNKFVNVNMESGAVASFLF